MKSMFQDNGEWSDVSRALDTEVMVAVKPIIERWAAQGYDIRHIQLIAQQCVFETGLVVGIDIINPPKAVTP